MAMALTPPASSRLGRHRLAPPHGTPESTPARFAHRRCQLAVGVPWIRRIAKSVPAPSSGPVPPKVPSASGRKCSAHHEWGTGFTLTLPSGGGENKTLTAIAYCTDVTK